MSFEPESTGPSLAIALRNLRAYREQLLPELAADERKQLLAELVKLVAAVMTPTP